MEICETFSLFKGRQRLRQISQSILQAGVSGERRVIKQSGQWGLASALDGRRAYVRVRACLRVCVRTDVSSLRETHVREQGRHFSAFLHTECVLAAGSCASNCKPFHITRLCISDFVLEEQLVIQREIVGAARALLQLRTTTSFWTASRPVSLPFFLLIKVAMIVKRPPQPVRVHFLRWALQILQALRRLHRRQLGSGAIALVTFSTTLWIARTVTEVAVVRVPGRAILTTPTFSFSLLSAFELRLRFVTLQWAIASVSTALGITLRAWHITAGAVPVLTTQTIA